MRPFTYVCIYLSVYDLYDVRRLDCKGLCVNSLLLLLPSLLLRSPPFVLLLVLMRETEIKIFTLPTVVCLCDMTNFYKA